ncbi:hypothetical protein LINPERPRIM_LOCUS25245 [Linum perenne]
MDLPSLQLSCLHSLCQVIVLPFLLFDVLASSLCLSPPKLAIFSGDYLNLFRLGIISTMSRGNQRDRDRERAQARAGGKSKQPKTDGLTPEQRRERDAKALQEKAARKAALAGGINVVVGGEGIKNKK